MCVAWFPLYIHNDVLTTTNRDGGMQVRSLEGAWGVASSGERAGVGLRREVRRSRVGVIWNSIFSGVLVPESMIEGLARRYRLVLVSNTNRIHFEMVRRQYPVLRHFHHMALSYQVKAMKPRPEIFLEAVRLAGCRAGECFYADDIPAFTEAARKLGIDAVAFESVAQLSTEMRRRGIAWE